jgi:hypothetical protein
MLTIQKWLEEVGRHRSQVSDCPSWPPDLFAICAYLLKRSGAYLRVFERGARRPDWTSARDAGRKWRANIDAHKGVDAGGLQRAVPIEVHRAWTNLLKWQNIGISEITDNPKLSETLIRLALVADVTSEGIGIETKQTPFLIAAQDFLDQNKYTSFTWDIPRDSVCVLGKQHTPQRGATLRSLSHHLALYLPNDIEARWFGPYAQPTAGNDGRTLNLLLLPWPEQIESSDFGSVHECNETDGERRWFEYRPRKPLPLQTFKRRLREAINLAAQNARRVDAIVFPELTLSIAEYRAANRIAIEQGIMLVGGVRIPGKPNEQGDNVCVLQAVSGSLQKHVDRRRAARGLEWVQSKHHRWCLDPGQMRTYQLSGQLAASDTVWESTQIAPRTLHFITLGGWMTWSVLICEDLARQDPAADLIRAVGPNLLIALLMDGPQLSGRWPSRYASVLAEDPGTSVLTLTSLGMALRSRPVQERTGRRLEAIPSVALWRDIESGEHEIILDPDDNACVLSLVCRTKEEFSAADPVNARAAHFPVFAGYSSFRVQ